jgi:hypothetical protein
MAGAGQLRLAGVDSAFRLTQPRQPSTVFAAPAINKLCDGGDNVKGNRMRLLVVAMVAGLGMLVGSRPAIAHHGTANVYDMSKPVVMKGVLTKFEWTNPHNQIYYDVTDEKGATSHWVAATEPPQVMLERGWTRKSLTIGEQVTVYIFVAKNGAPVGNLQKIVLANGTELVAVPFPPANAAPAPAAAAGK